MIIESPIIVLIAWSTVTGNQYLMPVNRVKEYTTSVTVGAVLNIIANLFLIHFFAANGAAMATVISEFAVTAMQLFFIRNTIKRRKLFAATWRYFFCGIVMCAVVYRFNQMMTMNIVNLAVQILMGIVIYLVALFIVKAPVIDQARVLIRKINN